MMLAAPSPPVLPTRMRCSRCKPGLRVTRTRRAIWSALHDGDGGVDAVTLFERARMHASHVSFGTVYRFLRELKRHGLVQRLAQRKRQCYSQCAEMDELERVLCVIVAT